MINQLLQFCRSARREVLAALALLMMFPATGETQICSETDINGLSSLEFIGGGLLLEGASELTSLAPLQALTQVHGIITISSTAVSDLQGLQNLAAIPDEFNLLANMALTSLNGFPVAAAEMGGNVWVYRNHRLKDLAGLSGLTRVAGNLKVQENSGLKVLTGLGNIEAVQGDVHISDNPKLLDCHVVARLLDGNDDGAIGPGPDGSMIPDVGQTVYLENNRPLCNSANLVDDMIYWDGAEI